MEGTREMRERINELESIVSAKADMVTHQAAQMKSLSHDNSLLVKERDLMADMEEKHKERLAELSKGYDKMKISRGRQAQLADRYKAERDEARKQLHEVQLDLKASKERQKELAAKTHAMSESRKHILQTTIDDLQAERDKLQEQLAESEEARNQIATAVLEGAKKVKQLKDEQKQLKDEQKQLLLTIDGLAGEQVKPVDVGPYEKKIERLEGKLATKEEFYRDAKQALDGKDRHINDLRKMLEDQEVLKKRNEDLQGAAEAAATIAYAHAYAKTGEYLNWAWQKDPDQKEDHGAEWRVLKIIWETLRNGLTKDDS